MHKLRRRLPPLTGLTTFEAAARHLSFTNAAAEMNVTQAAVSRQIRSLEEHLGAPLFRRQHRSLQLTAKGKQLHQAVTMGLEHIANVAWEISTTRSSGQITVAATIAFAAFWLMPRLARFHKAFPKIDVRVLASDRNPELDADDIDIAFTCGDTHQVGQEAHFLFTEEVFPVCSPRYLASRPPINTAGDLLGETLLHLDEEHWSRLGWSPINWPVWLESNGIETVPEQHGLWLNNYPMVVQAALDGQGIALGWRHLIEDLLLRGLLVRPVEGVLNSQRGYFLVVSTSTPLSEEAIAFRDWILGGISHDQAARGANP